jgi:hypothetical protein
LITEDLSRRKFNWITANSFAGNNSAWNYRYFLIEHQEDADLSEEIHYAIRIIEQAPNNRSPWNYLLAYYGYLIGPVFSLCACRILEKIQFCEKDSHLVEDFINSILAKNDCVPAFEVLFEIKKRLSDKDQAQNVRLISTY